LTEALSTKTEEPLAVMAKTVKGKGVSFMENNPIWHNGRISEKQFQEAIRELSGEK